MVSASPSTSLVAIPPRLTVARWPGGEGRLADFVPRPFRRAGADLRVVRPMSAPIYDTSAVPGNSLIETTSAHCGARRGRCAELD
jgi:hypothetical protein